MKKIYIVDDEQRIRELIQMYLKKEGYDTKIFSNAKDTLEEFKNQEPDLMILDIMMREMDGLELCREIRKTSDVPIIFVSARSEELDRILGLELGADDYLAKPFSPRELMVRVKTILKRVSQNANADSKDKKEEPKVLKVSDFEMYPDIKLAKYKNTEIPFTIKEFDILEYLLRNISTPLSREQITAKIWGNDRDGYERNVDDAIKRVRKKLKEYRVNLEIRTVWGIGYRIDVNE